MDPRRLAGLAKEFARAEGFALAGVAAAQPLDSARLDAWLAAGKHGEMDYMSRHAAARRDPRAVLPGVRSLLMVGLPYRTAEPRPPAPGEGRLSRYSWNRDYHDVLRAKLEAVAARLAPLAPDERFRPVVDSAPLLERDYARRAGLGWFGKNTLLLSRGAGSYFFLGALLATAVLAPDEPFDADHCGTCRACLDACPTAAFDGPGELDPRRCVSYLTIEHKSAVPEALRPGVGDWLFGCDDCQDACPWNRFAPPGGAEFAPAPGADPVDLVELLQLGDAAFRARFRGTPLHRARRGRVLRNACVVLGNQRHAPAAPALRGLLADPDGPLREAAAWALARIAAA